MLQRRFPRPMFLFNPEVSEHFQQIGGKLMFKWSKLADLCN